MSTARKIARQMAKTQMKNDGIHHPCRQYNKPGIAIHTTGEGKTSYFASHWRTAAAKRMAVIARMRPKKRKAPKISGIIQTNFPAHGRA